MCACVYGRVRMGMCEYVRVYGCVVLNMSVSAGVRVFALACMCDSIPKIAKVTDSMFVSV